MPRNRRTSMPLAVAAIWMACTAGAASSAAVSAAPGSEPFSLGAAELRFSTLTIKDGLPQHSVRAVLQDRDGFLWIGTQDGLARYDGRASDVFRHRRADARSLGDNHVVSLAEDAEGRIWIAHQAAGLSRYDPRTQSFERMSEEQGLPSPRIQQLLSTPDGGIWVVTQTGAVVRWDEAAARFAAPAFAVVPMPAVLTIAKRPGGGLWLGTSRGLFGWSGSNAEPASPVPGPTGSVVVLAAEPFGAVWAGVLRGGLWWVAPPGAGAGDGAAVRVPLPDAGKDLEILALLRDRRDRVWVGTNQGLIILDAGTRRVRAWERHRASDPQSLAADRVVSLHETRDGMIWAGTWFAGLSAHDPRTEAFVLLREESEARDEFSLQAAPAVLANDDGTFWAAVGFDGGLALFDGRGRALRRFRHAARDPESLASHFIRTLAHGLGGEIWVGTGDAGLDRLRADRSGFDHFRPREGDPESVPSGEIRGVYLDRDGALWVGTIGDGIAVRCRDCSGFRRYAHDPADAASFPADGATAFLRTRDGELWVGTRAHGILRLDDPEHGRFSRVGAPVGEEGGLSHGTVTYLREEADGAVWAGTQGGGLNRILRDGAGAIREIRALTSEEGLAADAVGVVLRDREGKLWASTTRGLSRVDPATLAIDVFDPRQGTQLSYFIGAGGVLGDGRIVLGGSDGVTLFDPAAVNAATDPVQPVLTHVRFFDPRLPAGERATAPGSRAAPLTLDHRQGVVAFGFTAPVFRNATRLGLAYRLDGRDREWIVAEPGQRSATYSALGAGDYRFRVRAAIGSTGAVAPSALGERATEAQVRLRVLAAPWATAWARAGYVVAALVLLAAVAWPRIQRLRERRAAQAAIEESEQRLKLALWGSGDELWEMDFDAGSLRRDHSLPGLPAAEAGPVQRTRFMESMEPGDRQTYLARLAALRGQAAAGAAPAAPPAPPAPPDDAADIFEQRFRVRGTDGSWRWLQARGRVVARTPGGGAARIVGTHQDISALKRSEENQAGLREALRHQAFHDPLTGAANRALFYEQVRTALGSPQAARDAGARPAVVFADLDEFKLLNDSLGPAVGDRFLCAVATRLGELLPPESGVLARLGGDMFAMLLDRATTDQVFVLAERVIDAFRQPFLEAGQRLHATASIGVAFADPGLAADELLRNADLAMLRAKRGGGGRLEVYAPEMHREFARRLDTLAALRQAIEAAAVAVHFQPIVELGTGRWVGAEALARVAIDDPALASPIEFIPIAEEAGLIGPLGELVLQRALADARRWASAAWDGFFVSVNVSPRQLLIPGFAATVETALAQSGWPGTRLVLEFTESTLMTVTEVSRANFSRLRALGVRLALDDFGTGYSSLGQLGRERFDLLKIAKPFVDGLPGSADSLHMAEAIIRMAESLGMSVVAEGVEHAAQADALLRLGCAYAQGYHFGRPLPAAELLTNAPGSVLEFRPTPAAG